MNFMSGLNDKQREAVLATEGYLRVIAGAGSGKTKLLVSRYAYLVNEYGIDTANILCVTFTNKAAGEMKRRIRALVGEEYDTSLICTYHGFCVRVLREDIEKMFFPSDFQIIDRTQQKSILADIYQKHELKLDHASFENILKQIAFFKANSDYVSKMRITEKCPISSNSSDINGSILEEFLQKQKQLYALDFEDLMYFTLYIFENFPEVLAKWQDRLNYIQVDEFQDSSSVEMRLIDSLCQKYTNLMIVGDPDQNIYEWRGSDVKLLVDFDKTHEATNTVFLNQNYRSTPEILKCANTLIENNQYRLKKDLFTENPNGATVIHYHTKTEYDEADRIIENIEKLRRQEGYGYSDFAVLYRSGFLSRIIEKKFTENGIPYEIYGGVKFYDRMEIQDILAYLRLIAYNDDVSFKRIVNKPRRRFGRVKLQRLSELSVDTSPLFDILESNITDPVFKNSGAAEFISCINALRNDSSHMKISDIVERVCSDTGYEKYIRELGDMERFENLSEFKRIADEFEKSFGETVTLKEFINQISLQAGDDSEEESDKAKLMTIHAAKGLEFPCVFIVGFSEGIFPSPKTIESRKQLGLEEERRLCYVAITRAEKRLFILDSEGSTQNGNHKLPSRFLWEMGEENYERIGNISRELLEESKKAAGGSVPIPDNDILCDGSRVEHPAFGEGSIISYDQARHSYRVFFKKINAERIISKDFFSKQSSPIITPEPEANVVDKAEQIIRDAKENRTDPAENSLKPADNDAENLWKHDDVPHSGWRCEGISDLGEPAGICEMCGYQIIRYVHHMVHDAYPHKIGAGCVCAGKMEGDIERAKKREQEFKNRQSRLETLLTRKWKRSKNGNEYLKIKDHLIVLICHESKWKYAIDSRFAKESYSTREQALCAAFDIIDRF
ncbi:MAG: UvrD-helicase domain-containing protein [Clostridia bacterium]|nr:UvrD-helicase domain-containing protein [Clostridia bacterium]